MFKRLLYVLFGLCAILFELAAKPRTPQILYSTDGLANRERFEYAIGLLQRKLPRSVIDVGLRIEVSTVGQQQSLPDSIKDKLRAKEHFVFYREAGKKAVKLIGADESGVLYGSMELLSNTSWHKKSAFFIAEGPKMVMRGTSIGLQKTTYLPGHDIYEYPYTPESFPWFYDKQLWINYLDMMAENKYNALYLWNGHPFSSLVKLKDYPYALEVDEATFKKNEDIYTFLTEEANKRGIWIIQMFYNPLCIMIRG